MNCVQTEARNNCRLFNDLARCMRCQCPCVADHGGVIDYAHIVDTNTTVASSIMLTWSRPLKTTIAVERRTPGSYSMCCQDCTDKGA
jgi:hypothetical protein